MRLKLKTTIILLLIILLTAGTTNAQLVTYIANSLPSSQGWTYISNPSNPGENNIFSVSNSILLQNSMGIGNISVNYRNYPTIDTEFSYYIELRARVMNFDNSSHPYGFCLGAQIISNLYVFGITPTTIHYYNGSNLKLEFSISILGFT